MKDFKIDLPAMPISELVLFIMLGLLFLFVMRALVHRDRSRASKIDFDDLLLDPDGRMSKSAIVMFGSFLMTTWMMIFLALTGKMSEAYLATYGALWIIPSVTKLIKGTAPAVTQP
jgi:hypothetical protein